MHRLSWRSLRQIPRRPDSTFRVLRIRSAYRATLRCHRQAGPESVAAYAARTTTRARTPMQTSPPKRNSVSLSITLSPDLRMTCRASTYSVNQNSGFSNGWKRCESRKRVKQHLFRMPRRAPPLSVRIRIPLPRQLRLASFLALPTRCTDVVTINRVLTCATPAVNNRINTRFPKTELVLSPIEKVQVSTIAPLPVNRRFTRELHRLQ